MIQAITSAARSAGGSAGRRGRGVLAALLLGTLFCLGGGGGCATIRTTDPPRTATEQFLLSGAIREAVELLSADALRDRLVFIDNTYLVLLTPQDVAYLNGELRAKLLQNGVRLATARDKAQIVIEPRTGGVGIDRLEFLLGIPAFALPSVSASAGNLPLLTPELAILKSTRQRGFASVGFIAYWSDTGELLTSSGPFVGRTFRDDWWLFGTGPRTVGDIPPAQAPTAQGAAPPR